jgi:hypothetical protein
MRSCPIPRHQPHAAIALDSQRLIAIEFDFVFPIPTLRQLRDWKTLHRFNILWRATGAPAPNINI